MQAHPQGKAESSLTSLHRQPGPQQSILLKTPPGPDMNLDSRKLPPVPTVGALAKRRHRFVGRAGLRLRVGDARLSAFAACHPAKQVSSLADGRWGEGGEFHGTQRRPHTPPLSVEESEVEYGVFREHAGLVGR